MALTPEARPKMAFNITHGHWQYQALPFGLHEAPAIPNRCGLLPSLPVCHCLFGWCSHPLGPLRSPLNPCTSAPEEALLSGARCRSMCQVPPGADGGAVPGIQNQAEPIETPRKHSRGRLYLLFVDRQKLYNFQLPFTIFNNILDQ